MGKTLKGLFKINTNVITNIIFEKKLKKSVFKTFKKISTIEMLLLDFVDRFSKKN